MAAIDKTYVSEWSQIEETIDWAKTIGTIVDDFGNKLNPMWWLSSWTKEYFTEWANEFIKKGKPVDIPMWNTPEYFDIWLIRNCPIKFIQDRLVWVYGEKGYTEIKNRVSKFDTYVRNSGYHYSVSETKYKARFKDTQMTWWISIHNMMYNEKTDTWRDLSLEPGPWTSSHCVLSGNLTKRKLSRIIRKWGLPIGTIVNISGDYKRYIMKYFKVRIKG